MGDIGVMPGGERHNIARLLLQPRLTEEQLASAVVHIRMTTNITRKTGFVASAYLVGDILVDSGFAHVRRAVVRALSHREVSLICCTHHHEDHAGNCGPLSELHGCPILMRNSSERLGEGLGELAAYRRVFWGTPAPYLAEEMPARIESRRRLRPLPIPGHSSTHTAFYEEETGIVFTGDLYISGGASAVMAHENPWESVRSLRRVAALEPSLMLTGHGLALRDPAAKLREKAARVEEAATRVVELHARGLSTVEVVRRVFHGGRAGDWLNGVMTSGEFSRTCFVRGVVKHASS